MKMGEIPRVQDKELAVNNNLFLNPDRVSMPDIDLDFEDARREEVIEYCRQKYGYERVSRIITFGRMAAKNAVIDMCRVMDYPIELGRKISKLIPGGPKVTLKSTMNDSYDFRNLYNTDEDAKAVIDMAMRVEGLVRNTGVHACGTVVSSVDISDYAPEIFVYNKDTGNTDAVAGFTMGELEEIGALKMDFLGLRTESVIKESLVDIENYHGISMGVYDIPINDTKTYEYLSNAHTAGVFQLESSGMTSVITQMFQDVAEKIEEIKENVPADQQEDEIRKLGDQCFERLCCAISLYRPGPMDEIPHYIEAMLDESKVTYDTPQLEPILKNTYGVLVYQEQVMQAVKALAGFSSGGADIIRKAMGKKKTEILDEYKPYFIHGSGNAIDSHSGKPYNIKGCVANGVSEEAASIIWDKMEKFGSYAFNKSHGAAYAVITAQTAWLANYYPTIFMKANMNVYIGNPKKLKAYLGHCMQNGIKMLPPSINESVELFSLNEDATAIRFGLMGVKNVGKVSYDILNERNTRGKFVSMQNFVERMLKYQKINSRALEALIYVGALDEFEGTRAAKIAYLSEFLDIVKDDKGIDYGFDTIFDLAQEIGISDMISLKDIEIPYLDEMPKDEKYENENEYSGFYITGHPLEDYQMVMKMEQVIPSTVFAASDDDEDGEDFASTYDGLKVKIAGIVDELEEKLSKNGKSFATFDLKDMVGSIPVVAFDGTLKKFKVQEGQKVLIVGRVTKNDFGVQITAMDICPLSLADTSIKNVWLYANDDVEKSKIQRKQLMKLVAAQNTENTGSVQLHFYHKDFSFNKMYVDLNLELFNELQKIFGEKNCALRKLF